MHRSAVLQPRMTRVVLVLLAMVTAMLATVGEHNLTSAHPGQMPAGQTGQTSQTEAANVLTQDHECPPRPGHPRCTHWSALPGPTLRTAAPSVHPLSFPAAEPAPSSVAPRPAVLPGAAEALVTAHSPATLQVFRS